jgi:hypothetical protein
MKTHDPAKVLRRSLLTRDELGKSAFQKKKAQEGYYLRCNLASKSIHQRAITINTCLQTSVNVSNTQLKQKTKKRTAF